MCVHMCVRACVSECAHAQCVLLCENVVCFFKGNIKDLNQFIIQFKKEITVS